MFIKLMLRCQNIYELYKIQKQAFWDVDEIDFSKDKQGFMNINDKEKHFIKYILAFFAYSDQLLIIT